MILVLFMNIESYFMRYTIPDIIVGSSSNSYNRKIIIKSTYF